jgi:hypothetical protein
MSCFISAGNPIDISFTRDSNLSNIFTILCCSERGGRGIGIFLNHAY